MHKKAFILLMLLAFAPSSFSAVTVAVPDLAASPSIQKAIGAEELRYLSDELRRQAFSALPANDYIVSAAPSDPAMYSSRGAVGKFGKRYTISVELYGSASGDKLLSSFSSESEGVDGLLNAIRSEAKPLFQKILGMKQPAAAAVPAAAPSPSAPNPPAAVPNPPAEAPAAAASPAPNDSSALAPEAASALASLAASALEPPAPKGVPASAAASIPANVGPEASESGSRSSESDISPKTVASIVLIAGGIGTLAYGISQNSEVNKSVDGKNGKGAVSAESRRNISYGVGASLLAGGIVILIAF